MNWGSRSCWTRVLLFLLSIFCNILETSTVHANPTIQRTYEFSPNTPIDVVIPCSSKDKITLDHCITSIKKNVNGIRHIFVVSEEPLTTQACWFDQKNYPFSLYDIAAAIFPNETPSEWEVFASSHPRRGWIYQQLLKMYAPFVIPEISSNVLIVDADVIFFRPCSFLTDTGAGLYAFGTEYHPPYFFHMHRLLPNLGRVFPCYSGVCHHILLQKKVLEDLFSDIRNHHGKEPWYAICSVLDHSELAGSSFSEYEIYFNYIFSRCPQMQLRALDWDNKVGSKSETA